MVTAAMASYITVGHLTTVPPPLLSRLSLESGRTTVCCKYLRNVSIQVALFSARVRVILLLWKDWECERILRLLFCCFLYIIVFYPKVQLPQTSNTNTSKTLLQTLGRRFYSERASYSETAVFILKELFLFWKSHFCSERATVVLT